VSGDRLHPRAFRLQRGRLVDLFLRLGEMAFRLGPKRVAGLGPADIKDRGFGGADLGRQVPVARRLPRLALQVVELAVDLDQDVFQPLKVLLGGAQADFRLVPARMQAGDAGRLFQDLAARRRLGGDQLADLPWRTMAGERAPVEASANSSWTSRARTSLALIL
jgi:hypothetical protein